MIAFLDAPDNRETWGGVTFSSYNVTNATTITISSASYASNLPLPAFHDDFITEFVHKLRVRLAQLLMWSRMAATELRRLQLQIPERVVPLPRQNRRWCRRVCAGSQRWRVWVP